MTVESTTRREQYATNGTTGPFTVGFYFLADEDIEVIHTDSDGLETTLALTTDYSVTGAGDPNGGAVTTTTAYPSGGFVTVLRNIDPLQETDYTETDSFPADSHERALDKATMLIQQLLEVTDRALVFSPSDEEGSQLPSATVRASKLLGFDSLGRVSLNTPDDQSAASLALLLASLANQTEGAGMIGYNPALPYAAGTVGARLRTELLATDFAGVDPTGASDSTAGLQAFLNNGGRLRIPAGTYIVSGGGLLGVANTHLTLDPGAVVSFADVRAPSVNSPWANTGFCLSFKGAIGDPIALTSNALAEQNAANVASAATLSPGDWVCISSQAIYEAETNAKYGEFAQVLTVVGNALTFTENLYLSYNVAATAVVRKMAFCENVFIEGTGEFRGGFLGQRYHGGVLFWYCRNFGMRGPRVRRTDYVSVQTYKSLNGLFDGITCSEDSYTGGNIGVDADYGSANITIVNSFFDGLCHAVDAHADTSQGGIAMNITAIGNVARNMMGAVFNTHPGVGRAVDFSHNVAHMAVGLSSATPTGMCAIRSMGPNLTAIGNKLYNVTGPGIRHMQQTIAPVKKVTTIKGNTAIASPTLSVDFPAAQGVLVDSYTAGGSMVDSVTIEGNHCSGFETGIQVHANQFSIGSVVIAGNTVKQGTAANYYRSINLRAASGFSIDSWVIANNIGTSALATGQGIYALGEAVGALKNGTVTGNSITGGLHPLRFDGCSGVVERGNIAAGYAGPKHWEDGAANSGLDLDRAASPVKVNAASNYTVALADADITSSVATTCTYTLPDPTKCLGRQLTLRTTTAQLCVSASANVVPLTGGSAGTDILAATAGKWATLKSNGAAWQITQAG